MSKFQDGVREWMVSAFGEEDTKNVTMRNWRFLEEALELVQSTGCTKDEALQLVDYVFDRDVGETHQEIGGVMVTLAGLSNATFLQMDICGQRELERCWQKIEQIAKKHKMKPDFGPLPVDDGEPAMSMVHRKSQKGKK